MDISQNRPVPSLDRSAPRPAHQQQPSQDNNGSHNNSGKRKPSRPIKLALAVVAALLLLGLAGYFVTQSLGGSNTSIDKEGYQAVFLTNEQVYFGELQNSTGEDITLKNIYYLQAQEGLQSDKKAQDPNQQQDQNNLQLVKLGSELHGPKDEMVINKDQVLFWENLKGDGKVAQAIKNYKD